MSKAPGSAGHIRKVVKQTTDRVSQQLEARVSSLAGREVDPEVAGRAIKEGIEGEGGFVSRFTETKKALYAEADRLIPDATLVTPLETRGTLQALANKVPDMEALNEFLSGSTVRGLSGAFPAQGAISYGVLRQVRTAIGDKLSSFDLVSDIPRGDLKQLYAALSKDLASAAKAAGPKAEAAAKRADRYYKAGISRIDNVLEPLIKNKVPELISAALDRSIAKGGSTIRPVMRSLTAQERRIVSGSIVRRLGSARPSQQGAEGGDFSFETFLTNWNKLDPKAKDAMFGWPELKGIKADLDALARWSDNMRESSQAFANPSGTASALVGTTAGFIGLGMGIAGALTGSASMLATPAILAVGALGTNQAARLMTSRGFVRWLASSTKVKPGGWGSHIGKLAGVAAVEDTETKRSIIDFMTALNQTPSE